MARCFLPSLCAFLGLTGSLAAVDYTVNDGSDVGVFHIGRVDPGNPTRGDLRYCINQANANPGSTISFAVTNVALERFLPLVTTTMTIGNATAGPTPVTIDGQNAWRIFFIDADGETVVIRNLRLYRGSAKGGDGGSAGGGGLGAGGAVFANRGSVRLVGLTFEQNRAVGGKGGNGYFANGPDEGSGGGGGLGGIGGSTGPSGTNAGSGGGGGFWGAGGDAYDPGQVQLGGGGGGGFLYPGGKGGPRSVSGGGGGGFFGPGQPGMDYTFAANLGAGGPGGGGQGLRYEEANNGPGTPPSNGDTYGGGGGGGYIRSGAGFPGGNGGRFGGGGGVGADSPKKQPAGNGGEFGGGAGGIGGGAGSGGSGTGPAGKGGWGGGGGGNQTFSGEGPNYYPGVGGYGGGTGGTYHRFNVQPTAKFGGAGGYASSDQYRGGGGGGGGALGGSLFVRPGQANVEVEDCTFDNGTVTAGLGGTAAFGAVQATAGTAAGSSIFFGTYLTLRVTSGTRTLPGTIRADQSEFGDGGSNLVKSGAGTLRITGTVTLSETISQFNIFSVTGGTLQLALQPPPAYLLVENGGTFDLQGQNQSFVSLYGGNGGIVTNSVAGPARILTLARTAAGFNTAGVRLVDGAGPIGFTFQGAGTLRFQGAGSQHTHSGPSLVTGNATLECDTTGLPGGVSILSRNSTLTVDGATALVRFIGNEYNAMLLSPLVLKNGGRLSAECSQKNAHTLGTLTFDNGGLLTGVNPDTTYGNFVAHDTIQSLGPAHAVIDAPVLQLALANVPIIVADGPPDADLVIASIINDLTNTIPGGLTKSGPGKLRLAGANNYSGGTTVAAGTLETATPNGTAYGALGKGNVVVQSGGVIRTAGDNSIFGQTPVAGRTLTVQSGGLVRAGTTNASHLPRVLLQGGTLDAEQQNVNFGNWNLDFGVDASGAALTSAITGGNVLLSQTGGTEFAVGLDHILNVSSVIDHVSLDTGLRKTGPGTLRLLASNKYTTATTLTDGTLAVAHSAALGIGGPIVFAGGTLRFDGVAPDLSARFAAVATGQRIRLDTNGQTLALGTSPTGAGGFEKLGAGTLTFTAAPAYTGATMVSGGTLAVNAAQSFASLSVASGATVAAGASGAVTLSGAVENRGTIRLSAGATLAAGSASAFTNYGLLDLLTAGNVTLPANFQNAPGGVVLRPEDLRIKSSQRTGATVTVQIDGYDGHTYTLQRSTDLAVGGFAAVAGVPAQPGQAGNVLTFTDSNAPAGECFYRVVVN